MNWINVWGIAIIVIILIPNIAYAISHKGQKNLCKNKLMNIIEQVGRYACIIFMIFDVGKDGFGFYSPEAFGVYLVGNIMLLIAYLAFWCLYFIAWGYNRAMMLAVIPSAIFLLCGITLQNWLLIASAVIFSVGHIYVTHDNAVKKSRE